MRARRKAAVRASISFPPDLYRTLDEISQQKKVSLACVVREAAGKYITKKWPLCARRALVLNALMIRCAEIAAHLRGVAPRYW